MALGREIYKDICDFSNFYLSLLLHIWAHFLSGWKANGLSQGVGRGKILLFQQNGVGFLLIMIPP